MLRLGSDNAIARRGLIAAVVALGLALHVYQAPEPAQVSAQESEPQGGDSPAVANEADQPQSATAVGSNRPSGWLIKIPLPIDGQTFDRVKRASLTATDRLSRMGGRRILIFEFHVGANQEDFGRGSQFGPSYQLADFLSGKKLGGVTTVAYVPNSIQGHAVLPVLACDEIIMARDAEIGSAGIDTETIASTIRLAYEEIADRRKVVPGSIAMGLVDPSLEVLKVQTEISTEYVTPQGLEELQQRRSVLPETEVIIPAGQPGRFTGTEARQLGFVSYLADDINGVARAMRLRPESIAQDPSLGAEWHAVRIDLTGPIDAKKIDNVQLQIEKAIQKDEANFICLWIQTAGGSLVESMRLANYLAMDLDPAIVRTVAYIPVQARADAALVALACDDIVMHPDAELGGQGNVVFSEDDIALVRETVRDKIAPKKSRSWSLPVAMIDSELAVYRMTRLGERKYFEYFSDEELEQQANRDQWQKGELVTFAGEPLMVQGQEAVDFWLADHVTEDFNEFKAVYGLENDPTLLAPGWADMLIRALASPSIATLLLVIGFGAMYIEMQMPGIGVGGLMATLCFTLFFWSRFLGGTAAWLEVLLFAAGVCCLLLEVFVLPGFGIFGLGGGLLIIGSLVLASQTFFLPRNDYQFGQFQGSLLILAAAVVGSVGLIMLISRRLPDLGGATVTQISDRSELLVDYDDLIGHVGVTTTQLTPSGKARIDGEILDVIADCELIRPEEPIEVVDVHGNRILVRSTKTV